MSLVIFRLLGAPSGSAATVLSSVEVFAQDGRVVLTDLVFPLSGNLRTDVSVEGGTAVVRKLAVTALS